MAVILTVVLTFFAALAAQQFLWQRAVESTAALQLGELDEQAFLIRARLGARANDLFLLKHIIESDFVAGAESSRPDLSNLKNAAAGAMLSRPGLFRVNLLNPDGREIFQLGIKDDPVASHQDIEQTSKAALQDNSRRSYFLEALKAPPDAAVLSAVDYSEDLKKPVIHISGKIHDSEGNLHGVLGIDYSADEALREIRLDKKPHGVEGWQILNADGTWLIGADSEWTFPSEGRNLKKQNPALWAKITSQMSGSAYENGFLFCFRNIDPVARPIVYPAVRLPILGGEHFRWTLLAQIPDAQIWREAASGRTLVWTSFALALGVLAPLAWISTSAVQRRKIATLESKRSAEAEDEIRKRLRLALEASHTGMWENNLVTGFITVDDTWSKMFGYGVEMTLPFSDFLARYIHPDDLQKIQPEIDDFLQGRVPMFESEHRTLASSGEWRWVLVRGKTVTWDEAGLPLRLVGVVIDITDRRLASQQLRETTHALEVSLAEEKELVKQARVAQHAKDDFLAMMSHEIRTPMNGVLGFAELLTRTPLQSDQKDYLQTIINSGGALLRIIEDILDFTNIESRRLQIEKSVFSPREVAANVGMLVSARASRKGILIKTDFADNIPRFVLGDGGRLRQILMNLAGNAIKFSHCGHVTISTRQTGEEVGGSKIWLEFQVKDMGTGIAQENLDAIFEPFLQADSGISRRHGGTGLGLSISRKLAAMMDGTLQVESALGAGTTFFLSLPYECPTDQEIHETVSRTHDFGPDFSRRHPLRILVAEDDAINLKLTSMILKNLGYDAYVAADGMQAVELFASQRPDLIFMDMQMPGMDGVQAAQEIRKLERESGAARPVFITALTANVLLAERERCFEVGMNDYITKPINRDVLAEALIRASEFRHCALRLI